MDGVLSAGVIVVRNEAGGWRFLLLRAYQYWDFPKGMVEHGEEPLAGAIREVFEETTINDLDFKWGCGFRETPPYGRGKVARYYVAETLRNDIALPVNPELGHPEHEEYRWVSYSEASDMVSERVKPILLWAKGMIT